MAKRKTEQPEHVDTPAGGEVVEDKKLTPAQVKSLFETYVKAKEKVDKAAAELEVAKRLQNEAVSAIYYQVGKGPFNVSSVPALRGKKLTVIRKGESYYFRGEGESEVIVV